MIGVRKRSVMKWEMIIVGGLKSEGEREVE